MVILNQLIIGWKRIVKNSIDMELTTKYLNFEHTYNFHSSAIINNKSNVFIRSDVIVEAGAILDACDGPIVIDQSSK